MIKSYNCCPALINSIFGIIAALKFYEPRKKFWFKCTEFNLINLLTTQKSTNEWITLKVLLLVWTCSPTPPRFIFSSPYTSAHFPSHMLLPTSVPLITSLSCPPSPPISCFPLLVLTLHFFPTLSTRPWCQGLSGSWFLSRGCQGQGTCILGPLNGTNWP